MSTESEDEMEALRALGKKHALQILGKIASGETIASSEIVIESGVQPNQVYRVLSELERAKLIVREEKSKDIKKPHVFWKLTKRGKVAKNFVDGFHKKFRKING